MGREPDRNYHIPVIIKNRGIFPILCCGYLWKSEYITAIRKFKGKWILVAILRSPFVGDTELYDPK